MTHLTMEQLVATREPGLEPQVQGWRGHVDACAQCRRERDRLDQRVARLKALPGLRPSRDLFGAVRERAQAERRARRIKRTVVIGLAMAASITIAVGAVNRMKRDERQLVNADRELAEIMSRSTQLEQALSGFDQDRQVVDGRTVAVTSSLEEQVARVDREIEAAAMMDRRTRDLRMVKLWRERVGLLDALVDVHLTGARYVGF